MDPRRRRPVHLPVDEEAGRRGEPDGPAEVFGDLELELAGLAGEGLELRVGCGRRKGRGVLRGARRFGRCGIGDVGGGAGADGGGFFGLRIGGEG